MGVSAQAIQSQINAHPVVAEPQLASTKTLTEREKAHSVGLSPNQLRANGSNFHARVKRSTIRLLCLYPDD